jgi:hypothetical protein
VSTIIDIGSVERIVDEPIVEVAALDFLVSPNAIKLTFSDDVSATLTLANLQVQRIGGGPVGGITYTSYDPLTNVATFTLPLTLADGNYSATVIAAGISSAGGPMPADHNFGFFVLRGDANRDRIVDEDDLGIVSASWQQSSRNFAEGNLNYDGAGNVDVDDLMILATQWRKTPEGTTMAGAPMPAFAGMPVSPPPPRAFQPLQPASRTPVRLVTDLHDLASRQRLVL